MQRRPRDVLSIAIMVAAVVVVIAIALGGVGGSHPPKLQPGETVAGQNFARKLLRGVPQRGDTLGRPDAPVTVVEFADLQCPVCKAFSDKKLAGLVRDYVRPGTAKWRLDLVRVIDGDSARLAGVARAAGAQDKLWNFAALAYVNQGVERSGYATDAWLRRIARGVPGLDVERALAGRESPANDRALAASMAALRRAGGSGTPTFLVGPSGGPLRRVKADAGAIARAIRDAAGR